MAHQYGGKFDFDTMYKNDDPKGVHGVLAFFFLYMLVMNPLINLCYMAQGYFSMKKLNTGWSMALATTELYITLVMVAASVLVAFSLYIRRPFVVTAVKLYFIVDLVILIAFIILGFEGKLLTHEKMSIQLKLSIGQLAFLAATFVLWFLYWTKSENIKLRFGLKLSYSPEMKKEEYNKVY